MNINPMVEFKEFWFGTFAYYMQNPWNMIALIIDIIIVVFFRNVKSVDVFYTIAKYD